MARLLQRVFDGLGPAVAVQDFPVLAGDVANGVQMPVLGLQHQQTPSGVQHHEVRVCLFGAYGHVVPQQVVGIELLLQPLGQASLARGIKCGRAYRRYQCRHAAGRPYVVRCICLYAVVNAL